MDRLARKLISLLLVALLFHSLSVTANHNNDEDSNRLDRFKRSEFNIPSVYNFSVSPVYYTSCNFDIDTCGWNQLQVVDYFDWTRLNGSTPIPGTRPKDGHTQNNGSSYYMYIDTTYGSYGQFADMISPPLLSAATGAGVRVSFYYSAYGYNVAELSVFAIYPRYETFKYLLSNITVTYRPAWIFTSTTFMPKYDHYQILIRGVAGKSLNSGIAIDDISITAMETFCYTGNGQFYNGTVSVSASGSHCQLWSLTNYSSPNTNFSTGHLINNYCRNPDGIHDKPWCVTNLASHQWELCKIPKCVRLPITDPSYPLGSRIPIVFVPNLRVRSNTGRVAIYHNGQWGTICSTGLTQKVIGFMCYGFGFSDSGFGTFNSAISEGPVWINASSIQCPSSSTLLRECTINKWGSSCPTKLDTWINCYYPTAVPPPPKNKYQLSLVWGRNSTSGVVRVGTNDNRKGVICSSSWNINSADVVCRQLGYLKAYTSYASFDKNPTRVSIISYIKCKGYENSIEQCNMTESSSSKHCLSLDTASVSCNPRQKTYTSLNKPTYCKFQNGLCGWKVTGNPSWIWYEGDPTHYKFFGLPSYKSYILLVRPQGSLRQLTAMLTSPLLQRTSSSVYVTSRYYFTSYIFERLNIYYRYSSYDYDFPIYIGNTTFDTLNWWYLVQSNTFRLSTSISFQIIIVAQSSSTKPSSSDAAIALDEVIVYGTDRKPSSPLSKSLLVQIVIFACAGVGFLVIGGLSGCKYYRIRRNRARRLIPTGNNRNSTGRTRLLDDDDINSDPMNFNSPQPPPSYSTVANTHQVLGDPSTATAPEPGLATVNEKAQNNDSEDPHNFNTQYGNPAAQLPPLPTFNDSSFI